MFDVLYDDDVVVDSQTTQPPVAGGVPVPVLRLLSKKTAEKEHRYLRVQSYPEPNSRANSACRRKSSAPTVGLTALSGPSK